MLSKSVCGSLLTQFLRWLGASGLTVPLISSISGGGEYTGIPFEEELKDPTRPVHPQSIPRAIEKWLADMAAGQPSEDEMRLQRADGEYRWFLVRTAPLRDEHGNVVKWYGVSIDIEDRKRVEGQSLALIDAIHSRSGVARRMGRWTTVTSAGARTWGSGSQNCKAMVGKACCTPRIAIALLKAWRQAVVNGTPYEQEERHRRVDGAYVGSCHAVYRYAISKDAS